MTFEDEFMDKQSEIIGLYNDAVNADVDMIFLYIYNDKQQTTMTSGFRTGDKLVYLDDAGITDDQDNGFFDIIVDEILPQLSEICRKNKKEMPVEFKYAYNVRTGAFDGKYRYESDVQDDFDCVAEGSVWIHSFR